MRQDTRSIRDAQLNNPIGLGEARTASRYGAAVADDRLTYVLAALAFAMTGAILVTLWLM